MESVNGESLVFAQEELNDPTVGSARALVIGAFAAGVLVGGALAAGLFIFGRTALDRLELGDSRPRRFRIGNLEIEERGDDKRFHVQ